MVFTTTNPADHLRDYAQTAVLPGLGIDPVVLAQDALAQAVRQFSINNSSDVGAMNLAAHRALQMSLFPGSALGLHTPELDLIRQWPKLTEVVLLPGALPFQHNAITHRHNGKGTSAVTLCSDTSYLCTSTLTYTAGEVSKVYPTRIGLCPPKEPTESWIPGITKIWLHPCLRGDETDFWAEWPAADDGATMHRLPEERVSGLVMRLHQGRMLFPFARWFVVLQGKELHLFCDLALALGRPSQVVAEVQSFAAHDWQ